MYKTFRFLRTYLVYTALFVLVLSPFAYLAVTKAAYNIGIYPNIGFYKMSLKKTVDRGQIGMSSTKAYDADIMTAYAKTMNSTKNTTEMPLNIWPNGYNMVQNNWNGTWTGTWNNSNKYVDIMFTWKDRTGDSVGQTY